MNDALQPVQALRLSDDARTAHDDRVIVEARIRTERGEQALQFAQAQVQALGDAVDRLAVFRRQQLQQRQGALLAHAAALRRRTGIDFEAGVRARSA